MIMSWLLWSQSFLLSYRASAYLFQMLFLFYLYKLNLSYNEVIKFIIIQAIVYALLYGYAMYCAPQIIFVIDNNVDTLSDETRGIFRIVLASKGFIILLYFLFLNKYSTFKNKKYLLMALGLFVIIVLMVTRQFILFSLMIGLFYLLKKNKYSWLAIFALFIVFNMMSIKLKDDSVLGNLYNLTEEQFNDNKKGDTNIRIIEYEYFCTEFNNNPLAILFGNGQAHDESSFGKVILKLKDQKLFLSDVGYAYVYSVLGLLGIYIVLSLFYRVIKTKCRDDLIYPKLYLIYVAFANIACVFFFGDMISICVALYIFDKFSIDKKQNGRSKVFNINSSF